MQFGHGSGVVVGHKLRQDARTAGGHHTLVVKLVLVGQGNPEQRPQSSTSPLSPKLGRAYSRRYGNNWG